MPCTVSTDLNRTVVGLTGGSSNRKLSSMSSTGRYWVYILASKIGGALYIGVTIDLVRRVYEHKEPVVEGFTSRHYVERLVYFAEFDDIRIGNRAGEAPQEMEPSLEGQSDRKEHSRLDRTSIQALLVHEATGLPGQAGQRQCFRSRPS